MHLFTILLFIGLPLTATAQSYTNCERYGNRMECQHGYGQPQQQLRARTIHPNAVLPSPPAISPNMFNSENAFLAGQRKAQEQMLLEEQREYYRNLNRRMR